MMKETIIQFGEGNFLRGFVDYFIETLHQKGLYDGKVVVIQPRIHGKVRQLQEQNCKYNLFLRGMTNGKLVDEHIVINSISRAIDPYVDFNSYINLANNKNFRFIVSNTTEAGIEFVESDSYNDRPAKTFPGKLTQLLYRRYKNRLSGLVVLCCELIDNNSMKLKECILKYAQLWKLENGFFNWIETEMEFANTLVDRITPGYPVDNLQEFSSRISYKDHYIDVAEIYHLWVIEGNYENELPLRKAGLNIIWTDSVLPYKKRKVRILNGCHTAMVTGGLIYGKKTVKDCLNDELVCSFIETCLYDEILPCLENNHDDKIFARKVLERFENPYIEHRLESIALNSISKFKERILPTIEDYHLQFGKYPEALVASLASLIFYYQEYDPEDDKYSINFIRENNIVEILGNANLWGCNISRLSDSVEKYLSILKVKGIENFYRTAASISRDNISMED